MRRQLLPALVMTLCLTVLTGLAYPLAVSAAASVLFPHQASGSLVSQGKGGRLFVAGPELRRILATSGPAPGPRGPTARRPRLRRQQPRPVQPEAPRHRHGPGGGLPGGQPPRRRRGRPHRRSHHLRLGPRPRHLGGQRPSAGAPGSPPPAASTPPPSACSVDTHTASRPWGGFLGETTVNVLDLNLALDRLGSSSGGGAPPRDPGLDTGREGRGRLSIYLGAAPGRGQDLRHARRGPPPGRAGHRRGGRVRGDPRPGRRPPSRSATSRSCPGGRSTYRGATFEEMDVDAVLARRPEVALVDELAHTNVPGEPQREAVAGRRGAAGRRHRRHLDRQHPAPRVAERRRRARSPASTSGRPCPTNVVRGGRADRAGRHDARGAPPPHGPRQHLRRRARSTPRWATTSAPGNLAALRELALLWVADRVDDALAGVPGASRHRRAVGDAGAGRGGGHRGPGGRRT